MSVGNDSEVQEPMETETCSNIQGTTTSVCRDEPEADNEIQGCYYLQLQLIVRFLNNCPLTDPVQANSSEKDLGENDFGNY